MRLILAIPLAALLQFFPTTNAEARGLILYGSQDKLHFVEQTRIPSGNGSTMALCRYSTKYHLFWTGFFRHVNEYALSDQGCNGDYYYGISSGEFIQAQNDGQISADLPVQPKLSFTEILTGFAGSIVIGIIILFAIYGGVMTSRRQKARMEAMGDIPHATKMVIDAMAHMARADGQVDDSEVTTIAEIARDLTGDDLDDSLVRKIVDLAEPNLADGNFVRFGAGLSTDQRRVVLKAVYLVAMSAGEFGADEQKFIGLLMNDLGLSPEMLDDIISEANGDTPDTEEAV